MKTKRSVETMKRRYERLKTRVAGLGPVLQGTILERTMLRDDPRETGTRKLYGPYYQWTRKIAAKTVTVNLTASQARVYQRAIDNHRKLESILTKMRELSLMILEASTEGVKKRKSRQHNDLNLK